ncbi:MAG TPA: RNA polymerase factor sigma-54, partial [Thermoanaerobaculia bacterium]|nr:RNA polymerase factor sigma-54 [Thermoanaerobaculia bacterium]
MALEQKLSLKLTQKLVMTPSLQQAIKLLQMTRMELEGVITQEMMENPTLEEAQLEPAPEEKAQEELDAERERKDELDHEESLENIDLDEFFGDYMESSGYASVKEHREAPPLENTLSRDPDLYDHLLWQLHMGDTPTRLREIAEVIIGNLDPQGFLVADAEEIRSLGDQFETGSNNGGHEPYTLEEVEAALTLVRGFDPPGIGYPDLRQSLIAQLERAGLEDEVDELALKLLTDHWDAFLKRQYPAIAKKLGVELHDLEPAVERIKCLETRPGRGFATDRTHYIEPDVYVRKVGQDWVIQINDDGMPRLRVSRAYRKMLAKMRKEGRQAEAQQFIKDKIRSAVWLIKSIDQRQRTIHKVANSIVHQQQEFLEHGIERLRPMVLRDVAEDIGMHESTVSRVVSNKYIHTPRGVLPMKYFFHSGIDREYGEEISSLTVKKKIQGMIDGEDPKNPL